MIDENVAVARLSELFALSLGIPPGRARQIGVAAAFHDVGKVLIPSGILNKPGKLTPMEFAIVKSHTKIGARMLSGVPGELGKMIVTVCEFHHEWADGRGYWGVSTEKLPDFIPIVSIADVFVACCAKRPYKEPWTPEQTLKHLRSLSGTQFSADTVEAFVRLLSHNQGVLPIVYSMEGVVPMWTGK